MRGDDQHEFENAFPDFKDERLSEYCCYCGALRFGERTTIDHVPSAGLIPEPHPKQFPRVRVCIDCNRGQSKSEAYFYCFLSAVLSGTPKYNEQTLPVARRIMKSDKKMRRRIYESQHQEIDGTLSWKPDLTSIGLVISNYARGHLFLDSGEVHLENPIYLSMLPISNMSQEEWEDFCDLSCDVFPEIGSRSFLRMMKDVCEVHSDTKFLNSFNVISAGNYSYAVVFRDGYAEVRSIIKDYLVTRVRW